MKGMGSKMKGLKMGFGKKKDKEDEPDKDKPDKTTGGIGSSAWRRRLEESAMQKLEEFRRLRYPIGLLRGVCNFMGATTGDGTWIGIRNAI